MPTVNKTISRNLTVKERLELVRKVSKLLDETGAPTTHFARAINIKDGVIGNWVSGLNLPVGKSIIALQSFFAKSQEEQRNLLGAQKPPTPERFVNQCTLKKEIDSLRADFEAFKKEFEPAEPVKKSFWGK